MTRKGTVMKKFTVLLCVAVLSVGGAASAKPIKSDFGQIASIDQYSGDTLVFLENNPPECEAGYWMRPTHAGFKSNLSVIEKAVHAKSRVKVVGNDSERWSQTVDKRCRLQSITVEPVSNLPVPQVTSDIDQN
jgi:outer membrane lipoprotein-sorting protein